MPCAQSLVSLLVTLLATVRVPRFRAVLIRLTLSVPVSRHLLTGTGLASDRWLSGGLGPAGGMTACRRPPVVRSTGLAADGLLSDFLGSRIGLTARVGLAEVLRTGIGLTARRWLPEILLTRVRMTSDRRLPGLLRAGTLRTRVRLAADRRLAITRVLSSAVRGLPRRFELRMLTGFRRESTRDGFARPTIDQVPVDPFETTLRRPPRSAEDPSLQFGLTGLTRRQESGRLPRISLLHRLHRMRTGSDPINMIRHLRHGHGRGIGKDGEDHAHRGAHTLLAEELHGSAVPSDDGAHEREAHARTSDRAYT